MSTDSTESTTSPKPVTGFFEGERLELNWRYAYRPEFVPLLLDYLGAQPGMQILDVGCGSGFLSRLLANNLANSRVLGLDADQALLAVGRQMLAEEGLTDRVELHPGDAYRLPLADDSLDLVTSHTLL